MRQSFLARAAAIAAGVAADAVIGDPQRHHPVAWFGTWALWLEKKLYRPSKRAGVVYVAVATGVPVAAAVAVSRRFPAVSLAVCLWASLGGSTLAGVGEKMHRDLSSGDLEAARAWVPWLCSRDPDALDGPGMARACVESLAENTCDAAICPLVYSVFGAPAVVFHRCVNTLDAMVGYRTERYSDFGWAAARLDDVLAWIPARITAVVHTIVAVCRGRGAEAVRAWSQDAPAHPSPNAGPVEATAAAALGVSLGGKTVYGWGVDNRPVMGHGQSCTPQTIVDAVTLARITRTVVAAGAVAACCARTGGKRQRVI
ncbi:adenosylcobinamide-phosphate synthase CbiB [Corynebacterium mendelii]|uniref:Cobalamin biosynthesis protein CobD n=1 Tax=Corynebacterium mendelii TaxID=2765362 RepID=A0A939DYB0_9CORY|nr:adenosylcobinamide-phosphate synthase CbiB [Corynebacterium mendelii]MBN9643035.1 cobalamin biosynthesis protein CobD [Corynebacterium mendelii]